MVPGQFVVGNYVNWRRASNIRLVVLLSRHIAAGSSSPGSVIRTQAIGFASAS